MFESRQRSRWRSRPLHCKAMPLALKETVHVGQRRAAVCDVGFRLMVIASVTDLTTVADKIRVSRQAARVTELADHQPDTFYLPELWLVATRVFEALGRVAEARRSAETGRDWVMGVHDQQVPEAFRYSFLHRNATNRDLLALASRLTHS